MFLIFLCLSLAVAIQRVNYVDPGDLLYHSIENDVGVVNFYAQRSELPPDAAYNDQFYAVVTPNNGKTMYKFSACIAPAYRPIRTALAIPKDHTCDIYCGNEYLLVTDVLARKSVIVTADGAMLVCGLYKPCDRDVHNAITLYYEAYTIMIEKNEYEGRYLYENR